MRKIVQISAAPVNAVPTTEVFALCDDGSVWALWKGWSRLPDIPQDGDGLKHGVGNSLGDVVPQPEPP